MIPPQLRSVQPLFIPLYAPEADVNSPGKQPVEGTGHGQRFHADDWRLDAWLEANGNVGRILDDDLVALDIDSGRLAGIVNVLLPSTFAVRSGGGGEHRYYRCPGFERNTQLRNDLGSVRSNGWLVVVPPSRHPSGSQYRVLHDRPIVSVGIDRLELVIQTANTTANTTETKIGGHDDQIRPRVSGTDDLNELISHDHYREEVRAVLHDPNASHHRRVWVAGFLYGAVGLSASEIIDVVDRHNRWSNYDRAVTARQVRAVIKSAGRR